jgi:hypothetical protein
VEKKVLHHIVLWVQHQQGHQIVHYDGARQQLEVRTEIRVVEVHENIALDELDELAGERKGVLDLALWFVDRVNERAGIHGACLEWEPRPVTEGFQAEVENDALTFRHEDCWEIGMVGADRDSLEGDT